MILYQITDGQYTTQDEESWLARLSRDADFIQIREKHLCARDLTRLVRRVLETVSRARILVNDRADIALASGAAGVHLRSGSVSPQYFKQLGNLIVTVSCHAEDTVSTFTGADYLLVSPIFKPSSKPDDTRPTLGLEGLAGFAAASTVPVLALGGITAQNAQLCVAAGAAGIAGIDFFRRRF